MKRPGVSMAALGRRVEAGSAFTSRRCFVKITPCHAISQLFLLPVAVPASVPKTQAVSQPQGRSADLHTLAALCACPAIERVG